jgi:hypothetical protein
MRFYWKDKSRLYCFTPEVSLATFLIEFGFAAYIFFRYKTTAFSRLAIAILLCLGTFQLAEHLVCTAYHPFWIKMGYVAITLLPALAIHLISVMTKRHTWIMGASYTVAAILIAIILFFPQLHLQAFCKPLFVEVHNSDWFGWTHFGYYSFFVLAAMYTLWYSMRKHIGDAKEEKWMLIAYVGFVVPALTLFYLKVITHMALPSVMCGFAIFVAIMLTLFIVPRYYALLERKRKPTKKKKK